MHVTSREVRLWKSGKYLLNSPSKASSCWLGNQVLRSSITLLYNFWHCLQHCQVSHSNFASPILHLTNERFDFVHKIVYQASFPLCVQLPKWCQQDRLAVFRSYLQTMLTANLACSVFWERGSSLLWAQIHTVLHFLFIASKLLYEIGESHELHPYLDRVSWKGVC